MREVRCECDQPQKAGSKDVVLSVLLIMKQYPEEGKTQYVYRFLCAHRLYLCVCVHMSVWGRGEVIGGSKSLKSTITPSFPALIIV